MSTTSDNSGSEPVRIPAENPVSLPLRRLLNHSHFTKTKHLPPGNWTLQRLQQSAPQLEAERLRAEAIQKKFENTTPQEREIIRKIAFKFKEFLKSRHAEESHKPEREAASSIHHSAAAQPAGTP